MWIFFIVLATLGDALVGFIDEEILDRVRTNNESSDAPIQVLFIAGIFGLLTAFFIFSYYLITNNTESLHLNPVLLCSGLILGLIEICWMTPYLYALQNGGTLNATPLFQSVPIFSLLLGILFFNEIPSLIVIIGIILIIFGAFFLNYEPKKGFTDIKTITLMLIASFIMSVSFFLFKDLTQAGSFTMSLLTVNLGMFLTVAMLFLVIPKYRNELYNIFSTTNKNIILPQIGNETLYILSNIAGQAAIVLGPSVAVVTSFSAFHPLFTLLIAVFLAYFGHIRYRFVKTHSEWYLKIAGIICIILGTLTLIT